VALKIFDYNQTCKNFEQTGQEEYKTVPYVKIFSDADKIGDILKWVKSVDSKKGIHDVYFTKPSK